MVKKYYLLIRNTAFIVIACSDNADEHEEHKAIVMLSHFHLNPSNNQDQFLFLTIQWHNYNTG
jgi:hypothetical protein